MERKIYFVFFSKEQKKILEDQGLRTTFARLEDGSIVEYTELCMKEKPSSLFDDFVLLGKGDFDHVDEASKDTVETKGQISRRKFDPPKLLLRPREKFKLRFFKNIFKKGPMVIMVIFEDLKIL